MARASTVSTSQTVEQKEKSKAAGSKLVRIASSMQNGITFKDIHSAPDGSVTIPGVNDHIRNDPTSNGILLDRGASICVAIPPEQWDEIKAKYGSAWAFVADPPLLREVKDDSEYQAIQSELKEVVTGAEPATEQQLKALSKDQ